MYVFTNSDGSFTYFGPGTHLRAWHGNFGVAHELLASFDYRCFHSPGPSSFFQEDDLQSALAEVKWLEVVSHVASHEEANQRIERARQIAGLAWDLFSGTCQDTMSWIVAGRVTSFQRDAIVAIATLLGGVYLVSKAHYR